MKKQLQIPLLPNEFWWGGATSDGVHTPYGEASFSRNLNNLDENQGSPLLISSKGRYVWGDAPFVFKFENGQLTIDCQDGDIAFEEGLKDLRNCYRTVAQKYFHASEKYPDELAFLAPQYNTWIEMSYKPTQEKVLNYAKSIIAHGMPPGVLIIDDNWMIDYGNWDFNSESFPNPKEMMDHLHRLGFKVMLWICPYVSPDSSIFRMLQNKDYLLKSTDGTPAIRKWWNGYSAIFDYTKTDAVHWFENHLNILVEKYGIDGFKFDAGDPSESNITDWFKPYAWSNQPYTNYDCEAYAKIGLSYGLSEYRACWRQGGQALIQRQKDKKPLWKGNGLDSLIPNGLLQGLVGYAFNCPDMIGGGMEGDINSPDFKLDMEFFIRFLQCSVFFPMMQFSIAPWRVLDEKHFGYCMDMVRLRQKYSQEILELAIHASKSGEPVIRHMEYVFPGKGYEKITNQFMLGDTILVAPVLEKGATGRTIVFPAGLWVGDDNSIVQGPIVKEVTAALCRLPYYTLKKD